VFEKKGGVCVNKKNKKKDAAHYVMCAISVLGIAALVFIALLTIQSM
jgi:hypothetical protein